MSKISDIIDAFNLRIQTTLSGHKELPNPETVDENPEPTLRQGWGLIVGPGTNTERNISCQLSVSRDFTVVITRKFYASELATTAKVTMKKQILEDQFLLIDDFEHDGTISGLIKIGRFTSDSGVQFVFVKDKPFYKIESTFNVEYFEDLT